MAVVKLERHAFFSPDHAIRVANSLIGRKIFDPFLLQSFGKSEIDLLLSRSPVLRRILGERSTGHENVDADKAAADVIRE